MVAITYSRAVAYGEKWKLWCNKNRHTDQKSIIPKKQQKKILIKQQMKGEYEVHDAIILEIQSHDMTTPKNWRYMT